MNIIMFFRMVEQKLLMYIQKMKVLLKIINSIDRKIPTIILYIKKRHNIQSFTMVLIVFCQNTHNYYS